MFPIGPVWENVLRITGRAGIPEDVAMMKRICRQAYYELCQKASWLHLRTSVEKDFASDDSLILPANLIGIDSVRGPADSGYRMFYPRDKAAVDYHEDTYRYYISQVLSEPEESGRDLSISYGDAMFSSEDYDALSDEYVGDYIVFADEPGFYEITAAATISPRYYGPELSDAEWKIRPEGTQYLSIIDPAEEYVHETVTVHYWRYPSPLYNEHDLVLLPSPRPLELLTLIRFVGAVLKREYKANAYRQELYGPEGALTEMIRMNPAFPMPHYTRDIHGEIVDPGADIFARRDGTSKGTYRTSFDVWRGFFE